MIFIDILINNFEFILKSLVKAVSMLHYLRIDHIDASERIVVVGAMKYRKMDMACGYLSITYQMDHMI